MFDVAQSKGVSSAKKSIITEASANIILHGDGNPTITRKECGNKFLVLEKRLFEFTNGTGTKFLFIICDVEKVKEEKK